jgi:hypothetical protein
LAALGPETLTDAAKRERHEENAVADLSYIGAPAWLVKAAVGGRALRRRLFGRHSGRRP